MNKRGRPTKYNAKYHPLLGESLSRNGFTEKEISDKLKITEKTLNNWKNKYPDFLQSIKEGKNKIIDKIEHALYKSALGYEAREAEGYMSEGKFIPQTIKVKHVSANVTAQIFSLKNLKPEKWRDKKEIIQEIPLPVYDFSKLSTEELKAWERMMEKLEDDPES